MKICLQTLCIFIFAVQSSKCQIYCENMGGKRCSNANNMVLERSNPCSSYLQCKPDAQNVLHWIKHYCPSEQYPSLDESKCNYGNCTYISQIRNWSFGPRKRSNNDEYLWRSEPSIPWSPREKSGCKIPFIRSRNRSHKTSRIAKSKIFINTQSLLTGLVTTTAPETTLTPETTTQKETTTNIPIHLIVKTNGTTISPIITNAPNTMTKHRSIAISNTIAALEEIFTPNEIFTPKPITMPEDILTQKAMPHKTLRRTTKIPIRLIMITNQTIISRVITNAPNTMIPHTKRTHFKPITVPEEIFTPTTIIIPETTITPIITTHQKKQRTTETPNQLFMKTNGTSNSRIITNESNIMTTHEAKSITGEPPAEPIVTPETVTISETVIPSIPTIHKGNRRTTRIPTNLIVNSVSTNTVPKPRTIATSNTIAALQEIFARQEMLIPEEIFTPKPETTPKEIISQKPPTPDHSNNDKDHRRTTKIPIHLIRKTNWTSISRIITNTPQTTIGPRTSTTPTTTTTHDTSTTFKTKIKRKTSTTRKPTTTRLTTTTFKIKAAHKKKIIHKTTRKPATTTTPRTTTDIIKRRAKKITSRLLTKNNRTTISPIVTNAPVTEATLWPTTISSFEQETCSEKMNGVAGRHMFPQEGNSRKYWECKWRPILNQWMIINHTCDVGMIFDPYQQICVSGTSKL